jgi:hypothetical protein
VKPHPINLQQELRSLALSLDPGVGKEPFDYEGFRAAYREFFKDMSQAELEYWTDKIKRMTPDASWGGRRT